MLETTKKEKIFRTITISIVGFLLMCITLLGIHTAINAGEIITFWYLLYYILLPATTFVGIFFLLRAPLHLIIRLIAIILSLAVFFYVEYSLLVHGLHEFKKSSYGTEALEHYEEVREDFPYLPSSSELGSPETIEYHRYEHLFLIFFHAKNDYLICKYNEAEYEAQKALLEERLVFQTEPMVAYEYSCEPAFTIDGYQFRTVSLEAENIEYPKVLVFAAINDETCEIIYLHFEYFDLDYITSMEEFLLDHCGWEHIR